MATTDALIEIADASVNFGGVAAVQGASLAIRRGEFVAVVGPNGSGKTTLLRLSARDNLRLALWLAARRWPAQERRARIDAALRKVGLWPLRERAARSLSGGEQQRLALARAWALGPAVLFLDEPTASLDPSAKNEVESVLAAFAAEGTTLVMSTHNLGQAKRLATRVVFMDEGRIALDLPTADFFARSGRDARASRFLAGDLPWSLD